MHGDDTPLTEFAVRINAFQLEVSGDIAGLNTRMDVFDRNMDDHRKAEKARHETIKGRLTNLENELIALREVIKKHKP
jgi:hypothetical protein